MTERRRGRPASAEFSDETKLEALRRANWRCERCGRQKQDVGYLEIHHRLGIAIALRYHPEISHALLSSIANARVLCHDCHRIEDQSDRRKHQELARELQRYELTQLLIEYMAADTR